MVIYIVFDMPEIARFLPVQNTIKGKNFKLIPILITYMFFADIFRKNLILAFLALILAAASCSNPIWEKEAISKVIDNYFGNLANELRQGGVTGIEITSSNIKLNGKSAIADASISINVYIPPTNEKRIDKDNVHFTLKKEKGEWVIKESKFDRTRF